MKYGNRFLVNKIVHLHNEVGVTGFGPVGLYDFAVGDIDSL